MLCQGVSIEHKDVARKTYRRINERNARPEVRVGLDLIDKGVLTPVASNESQAHESERDQKDKGRCASVDIIVHEVQENIVADLASACLKRKAGLTCTQEVQWQIEPDEKVEATNVLHKVPDAVSLVSNGGREIIGAVAFDMMVLDVVIVVRVPSVTHHWIKDVREDTIDQAILLAEHTTHVDVLMLQKGICAHVITLHDAMKHGVPPMEVGIQVDSRWDAGAEVKK